MILDINDSLKIPLNPFLVKGANKGSFCKGAGA